MQKLMLPAVLAAALLPSFAKASWLSEAIHRGDDDHRDVRYVPAYPAYPAPRYDFTSRYAPAVNPAPVYPAPAPVPPVVTAPVLPAPPTQACGDKVVALIDRLATDMRTLHEDVAVELPGARALAALADDMEDQAEHLQKAVRSGGSADHLSSHAVQLDRGLHEFLEATAGLGEEGEFLGRAARRVEDQDHSLMRLLSPAAGPGR